MLAAMPTAQTAYVTNDHKYYSHYGEKNVIPFIRVIINFK